MATLRRLLQGFQVPCAVRLWSMAQLGIYDPVAIAVTFGALGHAPRAAWEVPKLWFAASSLGFSSPQLLRSLEGWSAGLHGFELEELVAVAMGACALPSSLEFLLRLRRETARRLAAPQPRPKALQDFLGICWALNYCGVPLPDTQGIKRMAKQLEKSRRGLMLWLELGS